ncbi:MAG TPA: hypothetical protein DCE49_03650, partial [Pseudomonas sp.]|nr:hypothetical protein [Pseudomonas sp.]
RALEFISWPDAYGLFMTPVFILLYAVGAALERRLDRRRGLADAIDQRGAGKKMAAKRKAAG